MRRSLIITAFVTVLLSVVIGGHVYLAQRLIIDPGFAPPLRHLLLGILAGLAATLFLQPIAHRRLPPAAARLISWPAALWMGFAFLLLTLVAVSDLAWWLLGTAALADVHGAADAAAAAQTRAGIVVSLAIVAGLVSVRGALRPPSVRRVELRLPRWPQALEGFRIVQLSDLHIGPLLDRRFAEDVVARCNALQPDLIAVTGDLVDGSVEQLTGDVEPFAGLSAPHGVFFVTGNHDYYSGAGAWAQRARELGMSVLRNERVTVGDGAAAFDLAGVDDHNGGLFGDDEGEDVARALAGRDAQRAVILLAHDPATFPQAAAHGVDLQLSGHTHGGQIWPFPYLVRLSTPFVAGLHRRNGSQLYVSCGTGFWGPPMRLFAPAEITEITVRAGMPRL